MANSASPYVSPTREQHLVMLNWQSTELPLTAQADLFNINRFSLYYKPVPSPREEIHIKHRIDEIYTQYPFLDSRRITAILNREEVKVHRNTVQKYMRLAAIYPGPNLSKRNLQHRIYPYLLRGLTIERVNRV